MNLKRLQKSLEAMCRKQSFKVALSLKECKTGTGFSINGDDVCSSGSVRKIAILMAALSAVNAGKISLKKKITIKKKFQQNRSGPMRHLQPGNNITFQDALTLMIIVSDNTATGHIMDLLKVSYVGEYCKSIGMKKTKILHGFPPRGEEDLKKHADLTTPDDVAHLLDLILKGASDTRDAKKLGCTKKLCQLAIDILSKQMYRNRMVFQLPDNTKVAHKTGSRRGVSNDAGIVFFKEEAMFILALFTQPASKYYPPKSEANLFMAELSRKCYDFFVK